MRPAVAACLLVLGALRAWAHLGPPFPIIVDRPIPGYNVNVLSNPDVGQAVVIVVLDPKGSSPASPVNEVDVWSQAAAGRRTTAVRADHSTHDPTQYAASPFIDTVGPWTIGVDVHLADGTLRTLTAGVHATPPGVGPWGLLLFSAPIFLFGSLFVAVIVKRKRLRLSGRHSCAASAAAKT
ncbi:MAG TPA: hypothetical protein VGG34_11420 [Opitutaceae bacterium]